MKKAALWFAFLVCSWLSAGEPAVRNGTFDDGLAGWEIRRSENMGEVRVVADGAGGTCARAHKTVATPKWSAMGVTQRLPVDPSSVYSLSLRYRAVLLDGVVGYACRVFASGDGLDEHRSMTPSDEWAPFEWRFGTGPEAKEVQLQLLLTYSSGDLWVDDVVLRKVGSSVEAEAFADPVDAPAVADDTFSLKRGVEVGPQGLIRTRLSIEAGVWRVDVFGRGGGGEEGLTRRAVTVRLGDCERTVDLHEPGTKHHGRVAYLVTERAGETDLIVSRAEDFEGRLLLDRVAWVAHDGPGEGRALCLETPIAAAGQAQAVIVAGAGAAVRQAAEWLQGAVRGKSGVVLPIVDHDRWMAGEYTAKHAIAVGNMLRNKLSERLYCLWYTFEDAWYPGAGGWAVRSVHDPWGTGKNVIVLAGSDASGTRAAVDAFAEMLPEGADLRLGHVIRARMIPEVEEGIRRAVGRVGVEYAQKSLPRRSQRSLMSSAARAGMSYARSGDPERARMMLVYLLEHKRRPELGHDTHMELWKTIRAWDCVEECPAVTADERLEITNYLLYVLRSPEGVFNSMFVGSLGSSVVRHNHHMLAAMDAYYGGHYFSKYHGLAEAEEWLRKARFCFASQELQDKGQDESGNYEGSTALRPLLPYAYTEPGYRFLPSGTAKRFLDRCCVAIDNRFSSSGHGDCWDVNCFPPLALGIGAWYYRDGGYQYILEQRHRARPREKDAMQIQPPFRMDGVVEPVRPGRLEGVTVAPLNQGHYDLYNGKGDLRWDLGRAETFDKISFRTRFEPHAQYLLLDGIACGSHGHRDANCLIRFTDNDRVWLVDDSYTEGPFLSDHNGVLVTRDGIAGPMPACSRLDLAVELADTGLTRTTLPNHSGVDWERNIIWLRERCFIVLDRMKAVKQGNYAFRCLWRTLGTAGIEGNRLVTRQGEKTPEREDAMHVVFGGDVRPTVTEEREEFGSRWRGKYEHAKPVVNIHSQDVSRELAPGEAFTFANLLVATNVAEPRDLGLTKLDDNSVYVAGDEAMLAVVGDAGYSVGGVRVEAGLVLIREGSLVAGGVRSLVVDSAPILTCAEDVSAALDPAARKLVVRSDAPVQVVVAGRTQQLEPGLTEVAVPNLARPSFGQELAEASRRASSARASHADGPKATSTANVQLAWEFRCGSAVRAVVVVAAGERVVVGADDGTGVLLDGQGKELWRAKADGPMNAVATGDLDGDGQDEIVFAAEDAHVYAFSSGGEELWRSRCPPYPKRGGKRGQARDVHVADLDGDGKAEVVVGANNIELHILTHDGKERRSFHGSDPKMTFGNFATVDLDGDGRRTVLAFPASGSFGYGLRFELNGRTERFSTDGWPSHIRDRTQVDLDGDGTPDFACATNRGSVYYLLRRDKELRNRKVFSIGCAVTAVAAIAREGSPGLVVLGTEASYLHVLDGEGEPAWRHPTGSPVTCVEVVRQPTRQLVAVGTADGTVLFFDEGGRPIGRFADPTRVTAMAVMGEVVVVGAADGAVRSLRVDVDAGR